VPLLASYVLSASDCNQSLAVAVNLMLIVFVNYVRNRLFFTL